MKWTANSSAIKAFTFIELLVLIAIIGILAGLLLPAGGGAGRARITICQNNLKNLGIDFAAWSEDHGGLLPVQISGTNGGSKELIESGSAMAHFLPLTNYLDKAWLVCPSDRSRRDGLYSKQSLGEIADTNISYFFDVDASLRSRVTILAGDRYLLINSEPVKPGLTTVSDTDTISWSTDSHTWDRDKNGGNILFADGHVELVKNPKLKSAISSQPARRLAIP